MTFSEFIARKGAQNLHIVTGLPIGTIYAWKSKNLIPRKHWPTLLIAYPEDIGVPDLLKMEHASPVKA